MDIGYNPGINDQLRSGRIHFSPILFSAQYNTEKLSLTSEYVLRYFKYSNINDPRFDSQGFLVRAITFRAFIDLLRTGNLFCVTMSSTRIAVIVVESAVGCASTGRPAHSRFAKDITAGLRWNVTPSSISL